MSVPDKTASSFLWSTGNTVFLLSLLTIVICFSCSEQKPTGDAEGEVLATHERRRVATLNGDADAVGLMMTDDLTFTHANAVVETKEQFVNALKTRRLQYKALTDEDRQVRVHGSTGVVSGTCRILVDASGTEIDIRVRFTELWVKEGEAWRMMLWHATQVQ